MRLPSPALVTPQAVRRLPRWVAWLLMLAYVLPGFVGRDFWRGPELTAFAAMLDMRDGGPWWQPQVLGEPIQPLVWLPYWLGAAAMRVLPLPAGLAAQLPFTALLVLTLGCTWYATYRLARQPAALPLAPAFGEAVRAVDYARALADGALLALVATLGLAMLAHEIGSAAVQLAAVALLHWGGTRVWPPGMERPAGAAWPWAGIAATWAAAAMLALSGAPVLALLLPLALAAWWWRSAAAPGAVALAALAGPAAFGGALLLADAAGGIAALPWPRGFDVTRWSEWRSLARLLAWFVWPSALLALLALWRWRHQVGQAHIGWPLTLVVLVLAVTVADGGSDRTLLLVLPALATLAAWALPTLRGSLAAAIDWFALLFHSGAAVIVWAIWVAMMTGVPPKPAANVARLVPGFSPAFEPLAFALAAAATVLWLGLVLWRIGRYAPALWKGLVLSAAGLTLNWLLLMTLWLPLLNWGFGLRPISERIATLVPQGHCVAVLGLGPAELAALRHHGGLTLHRLGQPAARACPVLVTGPRLRQADLPGWQLRTEVARLRENRERWRLYDRSTPASP